MITNVKSYTFSRIRRKNHHPKTLMTLNDTPPLMTPEMIIADYSRRFGSGSAAIAESSSGSS